MIDLLDIRRDMGSLTFCNWSKSHVYVADPWYPREIITLGGHIRKKRLDLGLRQCDLVEVIGAEVHSIANWELGKTSPSFPRYYARIIEWLGYIPFPEPANIGERLWQIRMIRGITLQDASKEIGVDWTTYGRWEQNEKAP